MSHSFTQTPLLFLLPTGGHKTETPFSHSMLHLGILVPLVQGEVYKNLIAREWKAAGDVRFG